MSDTPVATPDLPQEDLDQIRASLLQWKNEGIHNPLIPLDQDLDGDGITDAFGLDAADNLVLLPGVAHTDTVSVSTGTDGAE